MGNGNAWNNPVSADCKHNRHNSGNLDNGDIGDSFNFTRHRCAASGAGASGGRQDCRVHISVAQKLAYFAAKLLGIVDAGAGSGGGIKEFMKLFEFALFLEFAQLVNRRYAIWISRYKRPVLAAMNRFIVFGRQIIQIGDVVFAKAVGR